MVSVIGSDSFAQELAKELSANYTQIEKRVFPDGEICPRISTSLENHVILAERMNLPLDANRHMMEILLTLRNLKHMGIEKVDLVMPYFIYSRQDKIFRSGEPFSAQYVLEMIKDSGVNNVFTVSSHTQRDSENFELGGLKVYNINGFKALGEYAKNMKLKTPVVAASDMGVKKDAEMVAKAIGSECVAFAKERDLKTGDIKIKCSFEIPGNDVIIVDDIISSGITMVKSLETAKDCGAAKIFCLAVHIVSKDGIDLVSSECEKLVSANTIDNPKAEISVVKDLAEKIRRVIE
jgi:ribose-phosphate pyrophosphokinase